MRGENNVIIYIINDKVESVELTLFIYPLFMFIFSYMSSKSSREQFKSANYQFSLIIFKFIQILRSIHRTLDDYSKNFVYHLLMRAIHMPHVCPFINGKFIQVNKMKIYFVSLTNIFEKIQL